MIGRFDVVLSHLRRRNRTFILQELSTGNYYRGSAILASLLKDPNEPGYNPGLRFAEVEYRNDVSQGTQGFIGWLVPNKNPGQRLWLYRVATTQDWVNPPGEWIPDLVNGMRQ